MEVVEITGTVDGKIIRSRKVNGGSHGVVNGSASGSFVLLRRAPHRNPWAWLLLGSARVPPRQTEVVVHDGHRWSTVLTTSGPSACAITPVNATSFACVTWTWDQDSTMQRAPLWVVDAATRSADRIGSILSLIHI